MRWPLQTLADLVQRYNGLIQTGPFGSQLHQHEYVTTGVPVVMPKDIVDGRIDDLTIAMIPEDKAHTLVRHILRKGDIVFPRRGNIRKCAMVTENQEGYLCGTGCIKISLPEKYYSSTFLSYYLKLSRVGEWLERNAVGTTMLNLNTSILGGVAIPDIDIVEQTKIASILSAYDDLIENNRRRIQLLEESARLLYREWFVHLRFPGHERVKVVDGVPEGWARKKVKDVLAKIKRPKKIKKEEYCLDGPIPCIDQSRDFIGGYTFEQEAIVNNVPIIVFGDHTRILKFIDFPFASGADGTQLLASNNPHISQEFLFFSLDAIDLSNYFYARHFKFLKEQEIFIPKNDLTYIFTEQSKDCMQQIKCLREHNRYITQARDLLLPKLMNGEIAV